METDGIGRVWIYGDSLSTGTHGGGAYLEALARELHVTQLHNFAVGSSGLSRITPNGMLEIMDRQVREKTWETLEAPDLIFVWHGTNDWYWGTPIGSYQDEGGDGFICSAGQAVSMLRQRFPEAKIVWATPIFRWEQPDGGDRAGDAFLLANKEGHTLYDYGKALEEASWRYHFPLVDVGRMVNIHRYNEENYLEDHVHPNRAGYERIERILIRGIRECCGTVPQKGDKGDTQR